MKILFVVNDVYAKKDANLNLLENLIVELKKKNVDVSILGMTQDKKVAGEQVCLGTKCFLFYYGESPQYQQTFIPSLANRKLLRKIIVLMRNPIFAIRFVLRKFLNIFNEESKYAQAICKACKKIHYDAVISISNPFYTSLGLARARINSPKYIYQIDPHATNFYGNERFQQRLSEENRVYQQVNGIFTTPLIIEDHKKKTPGKYLRLMYPLGFPCVVEHQINYDDCDVIFDRAKVSFVYTGGFYEESWIRTPDWMFSVFSSLPHDRYELHVIGSVSDKMKAEYNKKYSNVIFHGVRPRTSALVALYKADVLVNLGNAVSNQLPSKILDYISTGKPIINIYKTDDCPTLGIMSRYHCLGLSVKEGESIDSVKEKIFDFLKKNHGKSIPFSTIAQSYPEHTPRKITEEMLRIISKINGEITE